MKRTRRITILLILCAMSIGILAGCSSDKKTMIFADPGWDSVKVHNAVAGFIAEHAFGYDSWSEITGSTTVMHEALKKGEVDVHMEVWTDNIATYEQDKQNGTFKELGINFDDNVQGFYVPRYVIEGDESRGIKAVAPDLKTVQDLKKYKDIFPDDEDAKKGRIYGSIPGWEIDAIMHKKYLHYGLDEFYNYFQPGSDPALSTALISAYEKGVPIVGYYWDPTWLLGKYDFVLLQDEPYTTLEDYKVGKTECPSVKVMTGASNGFAQKDAEFCEFLKKYRTSNAMTSEALAHMQDTDDDTKETAQWFLKQHDGLLDQWLTADQAAKVRAALK